jgi:hypothetical protein
MTARIIDGNALSAEVRGQLAERAAACIAKGVTPCLAVILVGEDPASAVYVRNKVAACEKAGMRSLKDVYAPDVDPAVVFKRIAELNADPTVHGILVQLPLPKHFDSEAVLEAIAPEKDVDGFHAENVGALMQGNPRFIPCTPYGVMKMLESRQGAAEGRRSRHRRPQQHRRQADGHAAAGAELHRHHLPFAVEGPGLPHPPRRHPGGRRRPREDDHRRHDQARRHGDRRRHQPHRRWASSAATSISNRRRKSPVPSPRCPAASAR